MLEFVVAKGNVVSDIALVASQVERLLELILSGLEFLFLVQDATLGNGSFARIWGHLLNERLGVCHFFELILDVDLELDDAVSVGGVFNLLGNLASLGVEAGLEEALRVVEFVLGHVGVELGELVVHVGRVSVILHVEVAVGEETECSARTGRELQLVGEDCDDLRRELEVVGGVAYFVVLAVADE